MKKAEDLAAESFVSVERFRSAATRLKRLASGLRNEAASTSHGLTEKEFEVLAKAATILDQMSVTNKNAEALLRKRDAKRGQIKVRAQEIIRETFAGLSAIEDQVALIGALNISDLRMGFVRDRQDLDRCFKEALEMICNRVSVSVEKGGKPEPVLADLWASFQEKKPGLIMKFSDDIKQLKK